MSTPRSPHPPAGEPGTRASLEAQGFMGFLGVGQLHADRCEPIPDERGVYAVVRDSREPPVFAPRSSAPVYRHEDPSRPLDELAKRWVPGAQLLYLGSASGPGVRSLLRQRVKRYLRFGHGRVVGHWGGRLVWQLRDRALLRVAWMTSADADPNELASALLARFQERYGVLPFANLEDERED